jgi:hypothetical protein
VKAPRPGFVRLAFALAFAVLLAAAGPLFAAATPTPTPRPKLSGGFGRPRATPVAADSADGGGGQSLADVVKAAGDARGNGPAAKEKGSVTIDNKSLVKDSEKGRLTTSSSPPRHPTAVAAAPKPTPAQAAEGNGDAVAASSGSVDASGAVGGEAEWREMAQRDRKRVDDAKRRVDELTATTKKLENDFYAWDDGQYRDRVIKPAWDRAKSDLDQARIDLDAAEKELAELPEKARKAGALPGWIRE